MIYNYKLFSKTKVSKNKNTIDTPDSFLRGEINIRGHIPEEFKYLTDEEIDKLNKGETIFVTTVTTKVLEVTPNTIIHRGNMDENYYKTFSKEQRNRKVTSDIEIAKTLEDIGVDYLLIKQVHYVINDQTKLNLSGNDEITLKIKQALEEKGLSGIINI